MRPNPHGSAANLSHVGASGERFRLGDWLVVPGECVLRRGNQASHLEPRAMQVLVRLCMAGGEVVSSEQLLVDLWRGTFYGDNPVHKAIAQVRKALGDAPDIAIYIETVRKRGYRIAVPVRLEAAQNAAATHAMPTWSEGTPFRGLRPFDEQHAAVFFGRDDVVSRCLDAIAAQRAAGRALVVVVGRSGSGKTSLLGAGLLPELLRGADGHRAHSVARMKTDGPPVPSLALALTDWALAGRPIFLPSETADLETLIKHDLPTLAKRMEAALARSQSGTRHAGATPCLVLVLDPIEALLTDGIDAQQLAIIDTAIASLARLPNVAVVAACRSDFYPLLMERLPSLTALKGNVGHIDLPVLTPGELARCVRGPARACGLTFERDPATQECLDDRLIADAQRSPEALPMLQHVLDRLFDARLRDGTLTFAAYASIGGLDGAIACHADAVIEAIDDEARGFVPDVIGMVSELRLESETVVGKSAQWCSIAGTPGERLVSALIDARLFAIDLTPAGRIFRVTHDALLRRWPRALAWAEENREWLHLHERVRVAAGRWTADGRRPDMLWRSWRLAAEAGRLRQWPAVELRPAEDAFITASSGLVRRKRAAFAMTALIVCVLSVASVVLAVQEHVARKEADLRRTQAEELIEFSLGALADKLRPLGRLDVLQSVAQQSLKVLSAPFAQSDSPASSTQRVRALRTLAEVMLEQGDLDAAEHALSEATALLADLPVGSLSVTDRLFETSQLAYWQGLLNFRRKRLEEAASAWQIYADAASELALLEPENSQWLLERSYAFNNLGTVQKAQGSFDNAVLSFGKSITLKRLYLDVAPDPSAARAELADSLSWLADTLERGGRPKAALPLMDEQRALLVASAAANPDNMLLRHQVALAHLRIGMLHAALGQAELAIECLRTSSKSLAISSRGDPSNKTWQRDAANSQLQLGWILAANGQAKAARSWVHVARTTMKPLLRADDTPTEWRSLAALAALRAAMLLPPVATDQRIRALADVVVDLEDLHHSAPSDRNTRTALAAATLAYGDAVGLSGDDQLALELWHRAARLVRPFADVAKPDRTAVETLALALRRLSDPEADKWISALRVAEFAHPAFEREIDTTHSRSFDL